MIIGSTKEQKPEKRISITPETSKSFKNLGLNVCLERGYGESLGFSDKDYIKNGVEILGNSNDVMAKSNLICKVRLPNASDLELLKSDSNLIISEFTEEKKKFKKKC